MEAPRIVIIYASLTGCNEDLAYYVSNQFKQKGIISKLLDSNNSDAKDYQNADICIAVSYSYESYHEVLPDEMIEVYEQLGKMDLSGKIFGVLGTGQEIYDDYCGAVTKLEQQFMKTGAIKGAESIKIEFELSEKEDEEKVNQFVETILEKYNELVSELG